MQFQIVAMKLDRLNYYDLLKMANAIVESADNNVNFPSLSSSIPDLRNAIAEYKEALTKWGLPGNQGSSQDKRVLHDKRSALKEKLTLLAKQAQMVAMGNRTMLGTIAWPLKKFKKPVGVLQAVRDLRQSLYKTVHQGTIRIDWNKPFGTENIRIDSYLVMRSPVSDFKQAVMLHTVTKTTFTDPNPGTAVQYYWVIPVGAAGDGIVSHVCPAMAARIAQ